MFLPIIQSLLPLLFLLPSSVSAICYWPDGSIATNQAPCSDTTKESACCGQGYACLNNHLCKATGYELPFLGNYSRGSCTEKSWRSSSCSNACMGKDLDVLDDAAELVKCEEYVHRDFYYCSRSKDVGDCGTGYYLLSFPEAESAITTIGIAASTSAKLATSTGTGAMAVVTTAGITSLILTGQGSQPTSIASSVVTDLNHDLARMGIIIGGSVGGACIVAIVCVLLCWFTRRQRFQAVDGVTTDFRDARTPSVIHTPIACEAPGYAEAKNQPVELVSPLASPVYEVP